MISETLNVVEMDSVEIERWLSSLDGPTLFDPKLWANLRVLVQIQPEGDILPVRARYADNQNYNIGVNYYTSDSPQWYALPDIAASALLTGRTARVLRAVRIDSSPQLAPSLSPVSLRGEIKIDPRTEGFFRRIIEQRRASRRATTYPRLSATA
jgi:hypothetical protein